MCRRTVPWFLSALLLLAALLPAQQGLRVATWNVQALGNNGSTEWTRSVAVANRVDADVIAIEEVDGLIDALNFQAFATQSGFPHVAVGGTSGTLSGDLSNAVMSKYPIVYSQSWSAAALSGDPSANDITRDIVEVHVQVPNVTDVVAFFVIHLKASSGFTEDFRRAVELMRVSQAIAAFQAAHPGAPHFLVGDFNEDIFDGPFGNVYNSLPSGLPASYQLGNDVSFPVVYDPFVDLAGMGLVLADATQEDSATLYATRPSSGRRLDYVFRGGNVSYLGDEVYNSARDNGIDDAPAGFWLPKAGAALPSSYSTDASDHFVVFADCDIPVLSALFPGSSEDFTMETAINGASLATGPGDDVRVGGGGDQLLVHYFSPGESLSGPGNFAVIVGQIFAQPNVAPVGSLPGMWFDLMNYLVLYDGLTAPSPFQPYVAPFFGGYHAFVVPPGAAGLQVMIQTVIVSAGANNGWVGFSDGHRLDIVF